MHVHTYLTIHVILITVVQLSVNGTDVDSVTNITNELAFHVKENAWYIILCIRVESLEKDNLTVNCSTKNGTAGEHTAIPITMQYIHIISFVVAGYDYESVSEIYTFTSKGQYKYVIIKIIDNYKHDGKRYFLLSITSPCGIKIWIRIFIWDDEWGRFSMEY